MPSEYWRMYIHNQNQKTAYPKEPSKKESLG